MAVSDLLSSLSGWLLWITMLVAFWTGIAAAVLFVLYALIFAIGRVASALFGPPVAPEVKEEAVRRKASVVHEGLRRVDGILDELKGLAFQKRGGILKRHVIPIAENAGDRDITRARSLCDRLNEYIDQCRADGDFSDDAYAELAFLVQAKHEKIRDVMELIAQRQRTWWEFLRLVISKISNAGAHMIGHAGSKLLLGYG